MTETVEASAPDHNIRVRFLFEKEKPTFGDVFTIRGFSHPRFAPTNRFDFASLQHLRFDQVDDYFGISSEDDEGDDVTIWLFPLVRGRSVHHHPGPFDGLELSYDALRNPLEKAALFLKAISEFAAHLPVQVFYPETKEDLGNPPDANPVEDAINSVIAFYQAQGIEPGSEQAMRLHF